MQQRILIPHFVLLLGLFFMPTLQARGATPAGPNYTYYTLSPDITTNYITQGSALGYLRLQVDLMVLDPSLIAKVERHDPLIRDALIDIIGKESAATIKSLAGREELRLACLDKVNQLLLIETGEKLITELLFTKYLYQ
ncbi:flagellar basal body-associated protein FliL [Thaumasiovibrio sp. DFM-14]|uniref:flagellar basal body-associated protein FliL n=1 Tax=Thaumasiovibrio sp. DFM-14 TaxID=3384792 RepID=UPI0039A1A50F